MTAVAPGGGSMDVKATIARFGLAGSTFLLHLPQEMFERIWEFFVYPVNYIGPTVLAAGAVAQPGGFQVAAEADFVWCGLNAVMRTVGAPAVVIANPAIQVFVQRGSGGRSFMNAPVDILGFGGTGEEPGILTAPVLLTRQTTLQVATTNLDAANARNLELDFVGFAVY
jgi:hypothetical protein